MCAGSKCHILSGLGFIFCNVLSIHKMAVSYHSVFLVPCVPFLCSVPFVPCGMFHLFVSIVHCVWCLVYLYFRSPRNISGYSSVPHIPVSYTIP
jgi:hypothetical protein